MTATMVKPVLSETIGYNRGQALRLKQFALLVAGVLALWVSAKVQIATVPVPVTLQMLVIMVIGAAYGYCDRPAHDLGADAVIDSLDGLIPALEAL